MDIEAHILVNQKKIKWSSKHIWIDVNQIDHYDYKFVELTTTT